MGRGHPGQGGVRDSQGQPWAGYRPDRVAVVKPVTQPMDVLIIVDVVSNTWIERKAGDDCRQDRTSDAPSPPPPSNDVLPPPPGGDGAS
ncbi:DUF6777 domain-containing protein [Streptomyces sp. ISL-98]|uniref:DUF6777 domain-containing protein n=1 Tax=Streptomyces sp. ISL-98 TaxID=2819192 RepID=UPI0027E43753|nr:DUF6777 domain-containing protein [Streptomyces sp. ISL-98]